MSIGRYNEAKAIVQLIAQEYEAATSELLDRYVELTEIAREQARSDIRMNILLTDDLSAAEITELAFLRGQMSALRILHEQLKPIPIT